MPWEVLSDADRKEAEANHCRSKAHYPPTAVVYVPLRWVCPACGAKSVVFPGAVTPDNPGEIQ